MRGKNDVKRKVLIAYGGKSSEHDISIITAVTIYQKYRLRECDLILTYQTREGEWFIGEGLDNFKTYKKFDKGSFTRVTMLENDNHLYRLKKNKVIELFEIDFVINCFHGGAGEDGRFSGFLETARIPSSASSDTALGVAMDKNLTKMVAVGQDVSVVDFFTFSSSEWINNRERVLQQLVQFDFPVVVKPVSQGSSIGVSFASTLDEFMASVNLGLKFDQHIMVERAVINKREFNVCVLKTSEGKLIAKLDEPVANKVIISFKDKYLSGGESAKPTKLKMDMKKSGYTGMEGLRRAKSVGLTSKQKSQLVKASRLMYESLDMNGVVRFDYLMDTVKNEFYLGEINAVPGSLGYYFFDDEDFLKLIYDAGKTYWRKRFGVSFVDAPTIF